MGMYTEIMFRANIVVKTDSIDHDVIKALFKYDCEPENLPKHEFFTHRRWSFIGNASARNDVQESDSVDKSETYLWIRSVCEIKDGKEVADLFFDWVKQFIVDDDGMCIGYTWQDEHFSPTLVYNKES